jgi:hypothetical protein
VLISATTDINRNLVSLSIYPHDDNQLEIGALYHLYRTLSPIQAANRLVRDMPTVHGTLKNKVQDPQAALQAAMILLRSAQFDALYGVSRDPNEPASDDWLANLAE